MGCEKSKELGKIPGWRGQLQPARCPENPRVGGSIPSPATRDIKGLA